MSSCEFLVSAVFHLYPVFSAVVFGFMCTRFSICVRTGKNWWLPQQLMHICSGQRTIRYCFKLPLRCVFLWHFYILCAILFRILCVLWRKRQPWLWWTFNFPHGLALVQEFFGVIGRDCSFCDQTVCFSAHPTNICCLRLHEMERSCITERESHLTPAGILVFTSWDRFSEGRSSATEYFSHLVSVMWLCRHVYELKNMLLSDAWNYVQVPFCSYSLIYVEHCAEINSERASCWRGRTALWVMLRRFHFFISSLFCRSLWEQVTYLSSPMIREAVVWWQDANASALYDFIPRLI